MIVFVFLYKLVVLHLCNGTAEIFLLHLYVGLRPEVVVARDYLYRRKKINIVAVLLSTEIEWSIAHQYSTFSFAELPYLRKFSTDEIKQFETTPLALDAPSNSQFVERFIKLIAQNGTRAASPTLRDGLCHATMRSRQRHPRMETKADFSA